MTDKRICDVFKKYIPQNKGQSDIFEKSSDCSIRADRERRIYEVTFSYPTLISKKFLYELESNLCEFYELASVRLLPRYPSELFTAEYMSEIMEEARRVGVAVRGFFRSYKIQFDEEEKEISIEIPFEEGAMVLLELAESSNVFEGIIRSVFIRQSAEL